ncbi:MAG: peptidylprolyl isomerase [Verrucomicrobia bacterium]|nr:peptidylprolyl isomerase [Verrucomicrobiota bacterium]
MLSRNLCRIVACAVLVSFSANSAPVIDPIPTANIPAGKSLTIPITATSSNSRPLAYTVTSSTNRITVEVHTNNPFWKMSVVQVAPSNAPGAYLTPFRGVLAMVTNIGDMTLMLFRDRAPHTVDVFAGFNLAGMYSSNTIFHRVIPGFMIQGGDPSTNGTGGPVFRYDDEFHPRAIFSGSGQLALANSGKDTDGSQFFITLGPQRFLDFGYTLFGQLLRGFNVASNIISTPRNGNDRPFADVIITRASFVANTADTVITLTGTNLAGVSGTIRVIADDGLVGGRVTNTFTATTVSDVANNEAPILNTPAITNRLIPVNGRATNYISAFDFETNTLYYDAYFVNANAFNNSSNSIFTTTYTNGLFVVVPNPGYAGPLRFYVAASQSPSFATYDYQQYTFAVGDTAISAVATNFVAAPIAPFTNRLLATFTNGVPNSSTGNFTASINWGDNSISSGVIQTNAEGKKEVRGSHTYTNSGDYPVYVTVQSMLGAEATVVSTAIVPPSLDLTRTGTNTILRWPAWAAGYQLQSHTNLATANWAAVTNLSALAGYETVVTNGGTASNKFYRLKR